MGGLSSNDFCISCIILKGYEVQESLGRKPDWQTVKSLFSIQDSNIDGKSWEQTYRMLVY